jgi:hypothetical protein
VTITIELTDELREQIARDAEAEGLSVEDVAAARLAEWYAQEDDETDPEAVAEIGAALDEFEAAQARGERGLTVDEAFDELERRATQRRREASAVLERAA